LSQNFKEERKESKIDNDLYNIDFGDIFRTYNHANPPLKYFQTNIPIPDNVAT